MTIDQEHNDAVEVEKPQEVGGENDDAEVTPASKHSSSTLADLFARKPNSMKAFPPLWKRPVQRQKWGDTQIHPVVNWVRALTTHNW